MPAIFIYYITDYTFFLYVLSNEKAKIWARQQIKLTLSTARMTTKHPKTYHWSRENEVMKRIPGGSWAIYTCSWHQTAGDTIMYVWQRYLFFWKSNKDPPKPLDSKKCGISAAGLISLRVMFVFFPFYLQSRRGKFFTLPLFTADLQIKEAGK